MHSARLLVVDDEPALVKLMQRYLTGLGYAVDCCQSGQEACRVFSADPEAYALVVADMSMPDIPGEEMLARMLGQRPDIRVLVCSGYPFEISRLGARVPGQFGFLQKPFVPKMLAEAVAQLLVGGGKGSGA